ncbi:hypothetical protein, partial [Streptosporangium minutum]
MGALLHQVATAGGVATNWLDIEGASRNALPIHSVDDAVTSRERLSSDRPVHSDAGCRPWPAPEAAPPFRPGPGGQG